MLLVVQLREVLHHRVQRRRDKDLDLRLLPGCLRRLGRRFGGHCLRRRCGRLRRFRGATSAHPHQHRRRDDPRCYLTIHSSHRLTLLIFATYVVQSRRASVPARPALHALLHQANAYMRHPPFAFLRFQTNPSLSRAGCRAHAPVASAEIRGSPGRPSGCPAD